MTPKVPNCTLIRRLGKGASGEVWLGEQESLRRQVAIKLLHPPEHLDADDFQALFFREGEAMGRLHHPHVASVFDCGLADGTPYLVMEYLAGGSLEERLARGPLSVAESISLIVQIAGGLAEAHRKDIVHRDLKPANVMLRDAHTAVVTDFGSVHLIGAHSIYGGKGFIVGTALYMSPEQCEGKSLDARSDLYALGVIFYQLLSGQVPFRGASLSELGMQHACAPVPRLPADLANLQAVVDHLLAKQPEQRFANAEAFVNALRTLCLENPLLQRQVLVQGEDSWTDQLRRLGFMLGDTDRARVQARQKVDALHQTRPQPALEEPGAQAAIPADAGQTEAEPTMHVPGRSPDLRAVALAGRRDRDTDAPARRPRWARRLRRWGLLATPVVVILAIMLWQRATPVTSDPRMQPIAGGSFQMGSASAETDRQADEGPPVEVTVGPFALAVHEVSVADFRRFVEATGHLTDAERDVDVPDDRGGWAAGPNRGCYAWDGKQSFGWQASMNWRQPGFEQADNHPVVCVSWNDAQAYVAWLARDSRRGFRLPSEAEQEYVLRGGRSGNGSRWRYGWGNQLDDACAHGNVADITARQRFADWKTADCGDGATFTTAVSQDRASSLGLHGLYGNVSEWSENCYRSSYDDSAPAAAGCPLRSLRGTSWLSEPRWLRVADRDAQPPMARTDFIGFRVAEGLSNTKVKILPRGLQPVRDGLVGVYFSVSAGEQAEDGQGGSPFAVAFVEALDHLRPSGALLDPTYQSWTALFGQLEAKRKDSARGEYHGDPDLGPVCSTVGPMRAHLLVLASYRQNPLFGNESDVIANALSSACPNVEVMLHQDLNSRQIQTFEQTVLHSAGAPDGTTLIYVSGHGAEIDGKNFVFAVDADFSEPKTTLTHSLSLDTLITNLQDQCDNRCILLVDASRSIKETNTRLR